MKWGIIGALDAEVAAIEAALAGRTETRAGIVRFAAGNIGGEEVVVTCCGVGTVNAAATTQMMIDKFGVDCVVNTGIAGAMDKRLRILDMALSQTVTFHDADLDILVKYPPYKREFEGDAALLARAEAAAAACGVRCWAGRIATGDAYVTDGARKASINERFAPLCVEMEGAAVGQVAFLNEVPFLVLRTMSDNADDAADESYDNFWELAARHSAQVVLHMIGGSK